MHTLNYLLWMPFYRFGKRTALTVNPSLNPQKSLTTLALCYIYSLLRQQFWHLLWKSRSLSNSLWDETITFGGETDWCLWPRKTFFINTSSRFAEKCELILNWNPRNTWNLWVFSWNKERQSIRDMNIDGISDLKKYPLSIHL